MSQVTAAGGLDPSKFKPPASLDRDGRKAWRRTIAALIEQDTFQESDLDLVERYVKALQRARLAEASTDGQLYALGSMGQQVVHPGVKLARQAEQDADRYATRLLLSPEARVRAKVGDADEDPDLGDLLADPPPEAPETQPRFGS